MPVNWVNRLLHGELDQNRKWRNLMMINLRKIIKYNEQRKWNFVIFCRPWDSETFNRYSIIYRRDFILILTFFELYIPKNNEIAIYTTKSGNLKFISFSPMFVPLSLICWWWSLQTSTYSRKQFAKQRQQRIIKWSGQNDECSETSHPVLSYMNR